MTGKYTGKFKQYKKQIRKLSKTKTYIQIGKITGLTRDQVYDLSRKMGIKCKSKTQQNTERAKSIIALLKKGHTKEDIAEIVKLTLGGFINFCSNHNISLADQRRRKGFMDWRLKEIVALVNLRMTTRQMADKIGEKRDTIYRFCKRNNLDFAPENRDTFTGKRHVPIKRNKNGGGIKIANPVAADEIEKTMIRIRRAGYIPVYAENYTNARGTGIIDTGRFIVGMKNGRANIMEDYNAVLKFAERL